MNRIMSNVLAAYAGAGTAVGGATAYVLIKEAEKSPRTIVFDSILNGVLWPVVIYDANSRSRVLLKIERFANGE